MPASWCSYLIHIVAAQNRIEERVQVVEQAYHLNGLAQRRDDGETHDVTEVYGNLVKVLWLHRCPHFQSSSHRPAGREGPESQGRRTPFP